MKKEIKIAIAGGGSTYTPGIVAALIQNLDRLSVTELRLYDIDENKQKKMGALIKRIITERCPGKIRLKITIDPKEAFEGVNFVFCQIRVGGLEMREKDEKIPLSMGLVGQETCGAGGFSFGLRSISGILPIVKNVQKYAPDAWILNYTNPESIIAEAIRREFPHIKMINICDMTIAIEEVISENFGCPKDDFVSEYYGLNHFGWWRKIYSKSLKRDILPEILDKILNVGVDSSKLGELDQSWVHTFEMLCRIIKDFPGYLPNTYLQYYLYPDLMVKSSNPEYTRANEVMDGRFKTTYGIAEKCFNRENVDISKIGFTVHGEYIVNLATSILNNERRRFNVIVPNNGSIPNIRPDAVVEIPAYVGSNGLEQIALQPIEDFHKGLLENQIAAEKLLVDAYFENSYEKALKAFTLNRMIPSANVAREILDKLIAANGDYWPVLK